MENERFRKTIPIRVNKNRAKKNQEILIPILTVVEGADVGSRLHLEDDHIFIIGRDETCDLFIADDSVSRHHAKVWVEWKDTQQLVKLQDLGSTNKTVVNGKEVTVVDLDPGDQIYLGDITLLFEMLDSVAARFYEDIINKAAESDIDPLTKLLSKRFFLTTLQEIYNDVTESGRKFSLVVIDIDHFKQINDGYGHGVGDEILKIVSTIIRSSIRREDMAVRYGGDEMIIALPNTDIKNTLDVAERLRKSVEDYNYQHLNASIKLTVSIGVSSSDNKLHFQDLMKSADEALYDSKKDGRNKVRTR